MHLSAADIQDMQGIRTVHLLNPEAVWITRALGDAAGLRQLGVHMVIVEPGHRSGEYHGHHFEEECFYILAGTGTAVLGEQIVRVGPGDFIGVPAGGPAHELVNDGSEPLMFLAVGQRLDHDVVDFPRRGQRLYRHHNAADLVPLQALDAGLAHPEGASAFPPPFTAPAPPVVAAGAPVQSSPVTVVLPVRVRLLPIGPDGRLPEPQPTLPAVAGEVCRTAGELYARTGFAFPWTAYLAFDGEDCVGTCAFKAPPRDNSVEIAYFTFPGQEGQGYARSMVEALTGLAFEACPGIRVLAHTAAEENPATAVLTRLGFQLTGRGHDQEGLEVWEWCLQTAST